MSSTIVGDRIEIVRSLDCAYAMQKEHFKVLKQLNHDFFPKIHSDTSFLHEHKTDGSHF